MRMLVLLGILALATPALADTIFSTGSMTYSGLVIVDTSCSIYNAGPKPVTITHVGLVPYASGGTQAADSDDCTTAPLAADTTCRFSGSSGTFGGGIAKVKGSTKNLRGSCTLFPDAGGPAILYELMR
jgi:type 1 fimbria pilin